MLLSYRATGWGINVFGMIPEYSGTKMAMKYPNAAG